MAFMWHDRRRSSIRRSAPLKTPACGCARSSRRAATAHQRNRPDAGRLPIMLGECRSAQRNVGPGIVHLMPQARAAGQARRRTGHLRTRYAGHDDRRLSERRASDSFLGHDYRFRSLLHQGDGVGRSRLTSGSVSGRPGRIPLRRIDRAGRPLGVRWSGQFEKIARAWIQDRM